MNKIDQLIAKIVSFRNDRDWEQFHNSKDLSLAISIEAAELIELFLWKSAEEVDEEKLKAELADVLIFSLLLAEKHSLDIAKIISDKLETNALKYPVDKSKGSATKYSDLK